MNLRSIQKHDRLVSRPASRSSGKFVMDIFQLHLLNNHLSDVHYFRGGISAKINQEGEGTVTCLLIGIKHPINTFLDQKVILLALSGAEDGKDLGILL